MSKNPKTPAFIGAMLVLIGLMCIPFLPYFSGAEAKTTEHQVQLDEARKAFQAARLTLSMRLGCPPEGPLDFANDANGAGNTIEILVRSVKMDVSGRVFEIHKPGVYRFWVPTADEKGVDPKRVRMVSEPKENSDPCPEMFELNKAFYTLSKSLP